MTDKEALKIMEAHRDSETCGVCDGMMASDLFDGCDACKKAFNMAIEALELKIALESGGEIMPGLEG